ncbi:M56 family metallopeptidase [uncultured Pseudoteredinibacter sp.]|uniref:M56 family metallopeptidase n=1 Tax=uncultured Pseudoteredinibacter sp. TaxID=1641701 RepID=UPI00261B52FD|nr:M56 family metallopeptidase [uncultured Pseudoteredinibacter sp.]
MANTLLSLSHFSGVFLLALLASLIVFNVLASLLSLELVQKAFNQCQAKLRLKFLGLLASTPLLIAALSTAAVWVLANKPQLSNRYLHWHHVPEQFSGHSISGFLFGVLLIAFIVIKLRRWQKAQKQFALLCKKDEYNERNEHSPQLETTHTASPQPLAFSFGLAKDSYYISPKLKQLLSKEELHIVTSHEQAHCQFRDPAKLFAFKALIQLYFYPFRQNLLRLYLLAMEERADLASQSAGCNRFDIASTLIKVARLQQLQSQANAKAIATCAFSDSFIKARVEALSTERKTSRWLNVLLFPMLAIAIMMILSIDSVHHLSESALFFVL